jgi:hypothetical protein
MVRRATLLLALALIVGTARAQPGQAQDRMAYSRAWTQLQADAGRLRGACEDGRGQTLPCCGAIQEFERIGSTASQAPAPPEFGAPASTAAACGFGREAVGCRPGGASWIPHASIAAVYGSEVKRRREAQAKTFQKVIDAFKTDDDGWRANDAVPSPPSTDQARAAIETFRSCNPDVAAQTARMLDDAEEQDKTLLAARRREAQAKELQDATNAFETEEKQWRESLSSSDPIPDPIPRPPSSERARAAIEPVRGFKPDVAAQMAKVLDDVEARAKAAFVDEATCRATPSCNATRVTARAAAKAARARALAEEKRKEAVREAEANLVEIVDGLCRDIAVKREALATIARENSNPGGVRDLAALHEAGANIQDVDPEIRRLKALYATQIAQPGMITKRPFTEALCK